MALGVCVVSLDEYKDKSRLPQIQNIQKKCNNLKNWYLAQSNPCFEVWLYYHLHSKKPEFDNSEKCSGWKQMVNNSVKGGFDSRRHPIYIEDASINAEKSFVMSNKKPDIGSTNVYRLANTIIPLVKSKLKKVLKQIEK